MKKKNTGVAVDWIGRKLYWTDSTKDTIEVASLDNSTLRSVLINRDLVNPRGIAVDPMQKYVPSLRSRLQSFNKYFFFFS